MTGDGIPDTGEKKLQIHVQRDSFFVEVVLLSALTEALDKIVPDALGDAISHGRGTA